MTAGKSVAVVELVTQLRKLLEAVSISNIASKRGRPPTVATLLSRAQANFFASTRPAHAQQNSNGPTTLTAALLNEGAFDAMRKSYGLNHWAMSDRLILNVLALDEGADSECELRTPDAPTYAALQKRTAEELDAKAYAIARSSKRGGEKLSPETQKSLIESVAPDILMQLGARKISYKVAQKELAAKKLPVPSERSLRRMIRSKTGQKPLSA
jgi:hypothetical protein